MLLRNVFHHEIALEKYSKTYLLLIVTVFSWPFRVEKILKKLFFEDYFFHFFFDKNLKKEQKDKFSAVFSSLSDLSRETGQFYSGKW